MSNQPPWTLPRPEKPWPPKTEMTPLVRARITARRHSIIVMAAWYATSFLALVCLAVWYGFNRELHLSVAETVALLAPAYLAMWTGTATAYWLRSRADQRIAHALRQRVAQSIATDPVAVLRGWPAWLVVLLYVSALLIAALVAGFATAPEDKAAAVVFGCAVALFAVLAARWVSDTLRRPVIANDEPSLRADQRLRRADLRWALTPYPVVLGWVAKLPVTEGRMVAIVLSGYLMAASIVALVFVLALPQAVGWPGRIPPTQRMVGW